MRLGDLCDVCSGGTPKRSVSEYWNEGSIPWAKISDISGKFVSSTEELITEAGLKGSSAKLLAPGTLLYSIFASIGAVGILKIPAATNQAIAGLSIKTDRIERDYLYHYLKSRKTLAKSSGRGVAQNNINLTILRGMEVPVPAIGEQRAIVEQLEIIAAQIKQAEAQFDQLDSLVKSRFVEMFGDPIANSKQLETKPGAALFKIGNGKTKPTSERYKDGIPAYGGNGISWYSKESLVDKPTIVIGRVGRHCGNTRLVNEPCWVTDNAMYIKRFLNDGLDLIYLNELMRLVGFNRYADKGDLWKIAQQPFMDFAYPMPPIKDQRDFASFVAQVDKSRFVVLNGKISRIQLISRRIAHRYSR